MLTFGERLKKARERRGLTQLQVMDATGIHVKSLSRYETNATSPDPDAITTLIKLYDVSADYIMGLSPEMGHATDADATSVPDAHETLENLSSDSRKKAEEYLAMLKTLEEVKAGRDLVTGEMLLDSKKKA